MLTERKGSITVTAMVGTGLATLGVALFGMAGISTDLQAANRGASPTSPAPLLSPTDEVRDTQAQQERTTRKNTDCERWRETRRHVTGAAAHRET